MWELIHNSRGKYIRGVWVTHGYPQKPTILLSKNPFTAVNMNIEVLIEKARPLYSEADPAHDFGHIMRVFRSCQLIGKKEGADMDVLLLAALLHDCGCVPKLLGKSQASNDETQRIAGKFLDENCCDGLGGDGSTGSEEGDSLKLEDGSFPDFKEKDLYAIEVHGFSKGIAPDTLEAKILQDADRLDAVGAVGIARTFLVGGSRGRAMYHPEDPFCEAREPDDRNWNLDHFFRKLLKIQDVMHTHTGKELAVERTEVLKRFIEDMRKEIG